MRHTDDTEETVIARDRLEMIAFSSLKRLCEIYSVLVLLAGEVELLDATLRDHYAGGDNIEFTCETALENGADVVLGLTRPCKTTGSCLTMSNLNAVASMQNSASTVGFFS
jgi:hypothetical protein